MDKNEIRRAWFDLYDAIKFELLYDKAPGQYSDLDMPRLAREVRNERDTLRAQLAACEAERDRLRDGWLLYQGIGPDGELGPDFSKLLARVEELEAERDAPKEKLDLAQIDEITRLAKQAEWMRVTLENERLTERVAELTEQANSAYAPYRERIEKLETLLSMKNDALESYAEFYDKAAALCFDGGALPSTETDNIILSRLAERDALIAEVQRLARELLRATANAGNSPTP